MLALGELAPTERVNRSMFGRGHEPRARVLGDAGRRPLFERGQESILGQIFRQTDVTDDASQAADQAR
jgi:hypothetical protein